MALLLGLSGAFACIGGGGTGGGNLAGPGAGTPQGAGPNGGNPPPTEGPIPTAAAPGQQPTDLGWGNEVPGRIWVYVARPDGTVDLSTAEETGSTCKTSGGDSSPLIFPGEATPVVYGSFPFMTLGGGYVTNHCGQGQAICPKDESTDVYAIFNDQGSIYQSDTVRIDCNKPPPAPVVLTLKPPYTAEDHLPDSDGSSAPVQY